MKIKHQFSQQTYKAKVQDGDIIGPFGPMRFLSEFEFVDGSDDEKKQFNEAKKIKLDRSANVCYA